MLFFIVFVEFNDHIIRTLLRNTGEIGGHAYLFLKEQLEFFDMPSTSSILHGTIIGVLSTGIFVVVNLFSYQMSFIYKLRGYDTLSS